MPRSTPSPEGKALGITTKRFPKNFGFIGTPTPVFQGLTLIRPPPCLRHPQGDAGSFLPRSSAGSTEAGCGRKGKRRRAAAGSRAAPVGLLSAAPRCAPTERRSAGRALPGGAAPQPPPGRTAVPSRLTEGLTRGCRFRESNFRESNSQLSAPELLTGTKNPKSWQCCQGAQNAAEAVNHPECFIPLYII